MSRTPWQTLEAARRRRGEDCVSDLMLDRLGLGELSPPERERALAHLGGCSACANARMALDADRATFLQTAPVASMAAAALARAPAPTPLVARLGRWLVPAGLAAAAAVGLLWLRPAETTRTKGGFSLSTYVLHAEQPGQGALYTGEALHPGDRLQFRFNGSGAGYLAVVSVDAAKKVSVYYPPGPTAEPVSAGREVPLRTAVELDATLGRETVVGLLCERPLPVADIVAAAQRGATSSLPCAETHLVLDKAAPPAR